jgi:hypothetical protein
MATQNSASLPSSFGDSGFGVSPTGPAGSGGIAADLIEEFTAGKGTTLESGIAAVGTMSTVFHSGGQGAISTTTPGTDTTPVNTETYIVEVVIPYLVTITGIALFNGSAAAGNVQISLADSTGAPIAAALTASTAQSGTAAYQQIPFATPYVAVGPQKYFVMVQFDTNSTPRFRAHVIGNFGTQKQTAGTYGTFVAFTPALTFTTNQGPICDTY